MINSRSKPRGVDPFSMADFKHTDDQTNNLIFPAWEEIRCTADELKEELGCDSTHENEVRL